MELAFAEHVGDLGDHDAAIGVTPLGRDLLATAPRSHAERIFRRAIVESPSVVSIAHDLLDPEGPTAQALTQRLIHAGLGDRGEACVDAALVAEVRARAADVARAGASGRARAGGEPETPRALSHEGVSRIGRGRSPASARAC